MAGGWLEEDTGTSIRGPLNWHMRQAKRLVFDDHSTATRRPGTTHMREALLIQNRNRMLCFLLKVSMIGRIWPIWESTSGKWVSAWLCTRQHDGSCHGLIALGAGPVPAREVPNPANLASCTPGPRPTPAPWSGGASDNPLRSHRPCPPQHSAPQAWYLRSIRAITFGMTIRPWPLASLVVRTFSNRMSVPMDSSFAMASSRLGVSPFLDDMSPIRLRRLPHWRPSIPGVPTLPLPNLAASGKKTGAQQRRLPPARNDRASNVF